MKRHLPFQQKVLALVVSLFLFAQVMGLHRHMHSDVAVHGVQSELHFADAGLHDDGDVHTHSVDGAAPVVHEHHAGSDIEVNALGDALAKLSMQLLPLGLLMAALFLLALPVARRAVRLPAFVPLHRRHPFSLHPPANGPPRLYSTAD